MGIVVLAVAVAVGGLVVVVVWCIVEAVLAVAVAGVWLVAVELAVGLSRKYVICTSLKFPKFTKILNIIAKPLGETFLD